MPTLRRGGLAAAEEEEEEEEEEEGGEGEDIVSKYCFFQISKMNI
jgi:hypothetical protein